MRALVLAAVASGLMAPGAMAQTPDYDLDLRLDAEHGRIAVTAVITLSPEDLADGAGFLIGPGYEVRSVEAEDGVTAAVGPAPMPGLQRLAVAPVVVAGPARVTIVYDGPLAGGGAVNAVTPERAELSADSMWWPVPQAFNTHVTYRLTIRGLPEGSEIASPDRVSWDGPVAHIVRDRPSQDIALTASPRFRQVHEGVLTLFAEDPDSALLREYRTNGAEALAFLQAWFGPLPTERAVIAFPRRTNGTGYSRPGYLVVADVGATPAENLWGRYGYVAHELSHAWWSNADFTSEDYWLVESTAEYSALRFMESRLGREPVDAILERKRSRAARGGAILGHGRAGDDAVYARGPLLLEGLEKRIGRPAMDALLARLAVRPILTTADFLAALAEAAGTAEEAAFEAELQAAP